MYQSLEQRTTFLVAAIFLAIVVVGNMFGGALYGLVPLAACVSSGVFLWMKDLIRSGRDMEWQSERQRGQVVSRFQFTHTIPDTDIRRQLQI